MAVLGSNSSVGSCSKSCLCVWTVFSPLLVYGLEWRFYCLYGYIPASQHVNTINTILSKTSAHAHSSIMFYYYNFFFWKENKRRVFVFVRLRTASHDSHRYIPCYHGRTLKNIYLQILNVLQFSISVVYPLTEVFI